MLRRPPVSLGSRSVGSSACRMTRSVGISAAGASRRAQSFVPLRSALAAGSSLRRPFSAGSAKSARLLSTGPGKPKPVAKKLLPETLVTIDTPRASFHLLGTFHRTVKSLEHIKTAIEQISPDIVALELEPLPAPLDYLDSDGLLGAVNWARVGSHLVKGQLFQSFFESVGHLPLLKVQTPEMLEAVKLARSKGISVMYADRSNKVTTARCVARLPLGRRVGIALNLLRARGQRDSSEVMSYDELKALFPQGQPQGQQSLVFPNLATQITYVFERDINFAHALRSSAEDWSVQAEGRRKRVLGIFGYAHLSGVSHFLHSGVPPSVDIDLLNGESAEALQYHVDDLWLQMNRGLFDTGGCGECRLSIEDTTNTIVTHCQQPTNDGRCANEKQQQQPQQAQQQTAPRKR